MFQVQKIKKERNGNSMEVVEILAATRRLENCEEVPAKSSGDIKKRPKTGNDGKKVFKCADCDYSTLRWYKMKCHRVAHEHEEEFICDLCSFSSRLKCRVKAHSNRFHRNPPSAPLDVSYA